MLFAVVVYEFVIKGRGSTRSFLVGFGVVIPLALYTPFFLLEELHLENKAVKLSLATLPTVVVFRTLGAMFKTPSHICVEVTLANFVTYYSTLMSFDWSTKTLSRRKITPGELGQAVLNLVFGFLRMSLFLSIMTHLDFTPFDSPVVLDDYHWSWDLLHPGHLANSYLLALLTYAYLCLGFEMTAFSEQAKGYYTEPIFLNPILQSRSVREFWGQRWNLVIHRLLKHGVLRPARQYVSTTMAIGLAFFVSGLLHDFTWAIVFYPHSTDTCRTCDVCPATCFTPKPFKVTAFFLYCGLCMLLERQVVAKYTTFTQALPTILVAQLVLLTGLPVAHWYTGDWLVGGMFRDFSTAVFLVRRINEM